jgi:hypothetical protein
VSEADNPPGVGREGRASRELAQPTGDAHVSGSARHAERVVRPKFGDVIENGWASENNPTRRGYFVREFVRRGRLNPGRTWQITDGRGRFWEFKPSDIGERLTVIPSPLPPQEDR